MAALLVLVALGLHTIGTVEANAGCPGSTSNLGQISLSGTCTIDTDTTWENGTVTIVGDIIVNSAVTLTLNDVYIRFSPSTNLEFGIVINGALTMAGGGAQSTNANQWSFDTGPGSTVSIDGADFANGKYNFSSSIADIGSSTFRDTDSTDSQHLWIGARSNFHDNVLRNISISQDAGIVIWKNWGETRIWGNELHLKCYGNNCMGIEVVNMHENLVTLYPGFPTVEVAWNTVTWEVIASGTDSAALDYEYSRRLYVHNNTQYVNPDGVAPGERVTEPLEMGGPLDSIFENNTFYGPSTFGIYHYIYSSGNNLVQYNRFYDVKWGGIFQTGGSTYRYNEFVNVSDAGVWICPNSPCAGSTTSVNLEFYGNTFGFLSGADLVRADPTNMFDSTLIHHGGNLVSGWSHGGPVLGDGLWLYWANTDIDSLRFINDTSGARHVIMTAGGQAYDSTFQGFGATDNASLTVSGTIDKKGSANVAGNGDGTFLWKLGRDKTEVDVLATGDVTFTVDNFYTDTAYDVRVDGSPSTSFVTDSAGSGSFVINFASQHSVAIDSVGAPPSDDPPTASFVFSPGQPFVGDNITFDASLSSDDIGIVSYDWDFGNGDVDQGQIVTYAYPAEGTYNVTLTVRDTAGNSDQKEAPIQVATLPPPPDETAPARVADLTAVVVNSDYVVLQWRSPGDDGDLGQADAYDIRYSTAGSLSELNFANATPVSVTVPSPTSAGGTERLNVTGLVPGTDYWFALRAADEVPNWSPVSNNANATTLENATDVDATPPTVRITSPTQDSVISGTVFVVVEASDDTSVEEVVLFLDGSPVAALDAAPYVWAWSTGDTSYGWHTLRAEATDLEGNVGSDEVRVVVLPSGIVPRADHPIVEFLIFDPIEGELHVQFSKPMNRTSVLQALSIEPEIAYSTHWEDDSNLTVGLLETVRPDLLYILAISAAATDTAGTPLLEVFAFGFGVVGAPEDSGPALDVWLPLSLLLAGGLAAVLTLHLWSRKGLRRVRLKMKQLVHRIEELGNTPRGRLLHELAELESLASESIPVQPGQRGF
ncbi:MAG: PKD domain-containing protein [Thermoplasmata archaeon]